MLKDGHMAVKRIDFNPSGKPIENNMQQEET